ncbi:MAG: VOC family protein [Acetobacteraceae bacterium]|nr:VOC family protein [Acetobacteraceae bacterium]
MAEIDHIVIGAATLEQGAAWVERHLGARPSGGGRHEGAGTHNLLLGLGPRCYLEVIAPDPSQPEPEHPRLFDLDDPALRTQLAAEPRLIAYVARTPALGPLADRLGPRGGEVRAMRRGRLSWRMLLPPQRQDLGNMIPPMIQWDEEPPRLPDSGVRLVSLEAEHPEADALRAALAERGLADQVTVRFSPHPRLLAHLRRADGAEAVLSSD